MRKTWKWIWKHVALFAYRRWRDPNAPMPVGVPGNRDPKHVCDVYDPAPPGGWDCKGDGHYLCRNCAHFREESEDFE
jgi:hypothetical protein